jgi:ketosteroid isomerase-like protein
VRKHYIPSKALGYIVIGTTALLFSCSSHVPEENPATTASILRKQSDDWDKAIIEKRRDAIASNMSDDFRHIDKRGSISDKQAFLLDIMSDDLVIHPYTVEDFDVRVYGTCALLCGRTRMTGTYQGKPFQTHYRYIDTYAFANGSWKVVSVQTSPIPEP